MDETQLVPTMREVTPSDLDQRLAELAQQSAQLRDWLDEQPRAYTVGELSEVQVRETARETAAAASPERLRMEQEAAALTLRIRSDTLRLQRVQARLRDGLGEEAGPGTSLDEIWVIGMQTPLKDRLGLTGRLARCRVRGEWRSPRRA